MFANKIFASIALATTVLAATVPVANHTQALIPVAPVGNIASVQGNTPTIGDTRLYYQNSDGSITERSVSTAFTRSHSTSTGVLVPAGQALLGTSIEAVTVGLALQEIHLYFIGTGNVLNEYIWKNGVGWSGGPTCTQCIQSNNFVVAPGSKILYAMSNPDPSVYELRVGYVSAGFPTTIIEAVQSTPGGSWVLGLL